MHSTLVTGAAGFIGSHLAEALVARGDEVVGLDNFDSQYDPALKRANLARLQATDRFRLVEGDVRDPAVIAALIERHRLTRVAHLAALSGVRESIRLPRDYLAVNVEGTLQVLAAAARAGMEKVVVASSSSVYGSGTAVPFSEEQAIGTPASPYAASKIAAEAYCHVYHHLHGLPVVAVRIFNAVGPRQRPELALSKFVRLLLAGRPLPVYGDGTSRRDYTYVGDIVAGIRAALDAPLGYEVINLGNSQPVTLCELIAAIEGELGVTARREHLPDQPGDLRETYADIGRARRLLGWEPRVGLAEAVRRFVEWYRDAGRAAEKPF